MILVFIAAAALCLAICTAEIARRLALPQAFMLTALPWGLLTAGAIESGAPLWSVGAAVLVLSAVIAGRLSRAGAGS
ncbi:hypothetical protein KEF29_03415 [Streptomyces tuirus]|uniref:Uncharacterized protein n=1 Tax=Streptomyces tuirus TaxID=68278 RepID=A0A941J1S3_9ACTN|nr:hypothetical protein [Streptomyces tuirus]